MKFERYFFSEGWRVLVNAWLYAAIAIFGEYAIRAIQEFVPMRGAAMFASLYIWSCLAYAAHLEVLVGSSRGNFDAMRALKFALVTLCVFGIPVIGGVALMAYLTFTQNDLSTFVVVGTVIAMMMGVLVLLILSIVGTVLPAFVAQQGRGVGAALVRGSQNFFWTLSRLIIGPAVVYVAALLLGMVPIFVLGLPSNLLQSNYIPNVIPTVVILVVFAMQAYAVTLTAVILSRTFLRSQPEPGLA